MTNRIYPKEDGRKHIFTKGRKGVQTAADRTASPVFGYERGTDIHKSVSKNIVSPNSLKSVINASNSLDIG